jgi:hypothetical protein
MSKNIYLIILIFVSSGYVFSFITSILARKHSNINNELRNFIIYTSVGISFVILFWLTMFAKIPRTLFFQINTVSVLFHFSFLFYFIVSVTPILYKNQTIYIFIILCLCLCIIVVYNLSTGTRALSFSVANFILFFLCFFYYLQILIGSSHLSILQDPIFWIITGIFIGNGISLPVNIANDYILMSDSELTLAQKRLMGSLGLIPYSIMHICFGRGYLSIIKKEKK